MVCKSQQGRHLSLSLKHSDVYFDSFFYPTKPLFERSSFLERQSQGIFLHSTVFLKIIKNTVISSSS